MEVSKMKKYVNLYQFVTTLAIVTEGEDEEDASAQSAKEVASGNYFDSDLISVSPMQLTETVPLDEIRQQASS